MKVFIDNIHKQYNSRRILDVSELTFEKGRVYAILGLNGSGKSTLLECIAGLQKPDGGKILYDENLPIELVRNSVSMMTQKPYLFNKTVRENIESGLKYRKVSKTQIKQQVDKYLNYFELGEVLHKNARTLSGGEAAKTAILRTAVLETSLVLLDEPTASMDMESTLSAERLVKDLAQETRTVIFVTHDLYQAQRCADEVVFMDKGKIIESGATHLVFKNPQNHFLKMILNQR